MEKRHGYWKTVLATVMAILIGIGVAVEGAVAATYGHAVGYYGVMAMVLALCAIPLRYALIAMRAPSWLEEAAVYTAIFMVVSAWDGSFKGGAKETIVGVFMLVGVAMALSTWILPWLRRALVDSWNERRTTG